MSTLTHRGACNNKTFYTTPCLLSGINKPMPLSVCTKVQGCSFTYILTFGRKNTARCIFLLSHQSIIQIVLQLANKYVGCTVLFKTVNEF